MTMHLLIRTECSPDEDDVYIALCGYRSGKEKEFIDGTRQKTAKIDCHGCHYKKSEERNDEHELRGIV